MAANWIIYSVDAEAYLKLLRLFFYCAYDFQCVTSNPRAHTHTRKLFGVDGQSANQKVDQKSSPSTFAFSPNKYRQIVYHKLNSVQNKYQLSESMGIYLNEKMHERLIHDNMVKPSGNIEIIVGVGRSLKRKYEQKHQSYTWNHVWH